jgi:glycosyltransferase involved in cell wall biosynthesis
MSSADAATTPAAGHRPAVTVLMPVHNAGAFLREAVDSILAQTFKDFEFLVINDGSTDGAFDALRTLRDPRLRLVDNPRNLGLIATLNLGLKLARAPLLARMDADDVSLPQRLERQVAAFAERPTLALLGTWAEVMGPGGAAAGTMRTPVAHAEVVRAMLCDNAFVHPSVMAQTEVLRALGGFPAAAVHAEDYALWLRVAARHETANLPEVLLSYRVHAGQVSQRKMRAQRRMAEALQAAARAEFAALGVLPAHAQPRAPGWLDKLRGRRGTLGADYLHWARRNWALGQGQKGAAAAWQGLMTAPLCAELWRLLTPPQASPRYWWRRACGRRS